MRNISAIARALAGKNNEKEVDALLKTLKSVVDSGIPAPKALSLLAGHIDARYAKLVSCVRRAIEMDESLVRLRRRLARQGLRGVHANTLLACAFSYIARRKKNIAPKDIVRVAEVTGWAVSERSLRLLIRRGILIVRDNKLSMDKQVFRRLSGHLPPRRVVVAAYLPHAPLEDKVMALVRERGRVSADDVARELGEDAKSVLLALQEEGRVLKLKGNVYAPA